MACGLIKGQIVESGLPLHAYDSFEDAAAKSLA